jgi:hypothetical protein
VAVDPPGRASQSQEVYRRGKDPHRDGRDSRGSVGSRSVPAPTCLQRGSYLGVRGYSATRTGTPWDQNLLLNRKFRPLLRALDIQVQRGNDFHAFCHANATLMSSFGASQKLRQQRLGHADGSPVMETIYTHVISEDEKRIAAQLGNAVWGVLDPSWTPKRLLLWKGRGFDNGGRQHCERSWVRSHHTYQLSPSLLNPNFSSDK